MTATGTALAGIAVGLIAGKWALVGYGGGPALYLWVASASAFVGLVLVVVGSVGSRGSPPTPQPREPA